MVIMVILMTQAPKIGNAIYDARTQENQLLTQRAIFHARWRLEDDFRSTKRLETVQKKHQRTASNLLENLSLKGASLGIIITLGAVIWLMIRLLI
jgi:hypothetical protein